MSWARKGPLYCRILSFDSALVEYEPIYHREDGSERPGSHRWLPIAGFIQETLRSLLRGNLTTASGRESAPGPARTDGPLENRGSAT